VRRSWKSTGRWRGCTHARNRGENASEDPPGVRGTAWHGHINRDDVRDRPATRVTLAKDAAGAAAVAEGHYELWIWCCLVRTLQRHFHVLLHRSRDEQQIRVPRTRHESDTEAFEIVEGIVERVDLKLAAVARACIDVTDAECPAEHRPNVRLQTVANAQVFVRLRRWLGDDADEGDLAQCL